MKSIINLSIETDVNTFALKLELFENVKKSLIEKISLLIEKMKNVIY